MEDKKVEFINRLNLLQKELGVEISANYHGGMVVCGCKNVVDLSIASRDEHNNLIYVE